MKSQFLHRFGLPCVSRIIENDLSPFGKKDLFYLRPGCILREEPSGYLLSPAEHYPDAIIIDEELKLLLDSRPFSMEYLPTFIAQMLIDGRGAAQLSIALEADKLIYLIDQQGVLDRNRKLLSQIDGFQVADLLVDEAIESTSSRGVSKKILAYAGVAVGKVKRVHIVNKDDLIEELFSCTGTGTMIVEKLVSYEGCRVANHEDIPCIRALLKRFGFTPVKSIGLLISSFMVFVADFEMYGCALCTKTANTMKIEYFVADKFQEMDVIDELFKCILKTAEENGCTKIVVTENNHRQFLSHVSIFKLGFDMVISGTETQWIKHLS